MENKKYTPGPWTAFEDDAVCVDHNMEKLICDIRGWGWMQKMGKDKAIEMQKANAKLIAAAPELLEALIKARGLLLMAAAECGNYAEAIEDAVYRDAAGIDRAIKKALD